MGEQRMHVTAGVPTPEYSIVFIHGRGEAASTNDRWLSGLARSLKRAGYELERSQLRSLALAPVYTDLLRSDAVQDRDQRPPKSYRGPTGDRLIAARKRYEASQDLLRKRVGEGRTTSGPDRVIRTLSERAQLTERLIGWRYADVQRYCRDRAVRLAILTRVMASLPEHGRCLVVGHSLGSVVALDALNYWPPGLPIDLLLTCGSPVALEPIRKYLEGRRRRWPFELVGGWLNLYDATDPVTGGTGLSRWFEEKVCDLHVENGGTKSHHGIDRYLEHVQVGLVAGGYLTDGLVGRGTRQADDNRRHDDELLRAVKLERAVVQAYALQLESRTESQKTKARMFEARARQRALASLELSLTPDTHLSDDLEALAEGLEVEQRLWVLLNLAVDPPFHPYEIKPDSSTVQPALEWIAERVGEPPSSVEPLLKAVKEARGVQEASKVPLVVSGGIAIALLAVATGGVALAAAPGLAGAASLTSGLAGLGALVGGGMAAGIGVVAGSSAGSLGLAIVALRTLSPEQVRQDVIKLHAVAAYKRDRRVRDRGEGEIALLENLLEEAEDRRREHCVTDDGGPKSATAKDWKKKREAIRKALDDLRPAASGREQG